MRRPPGVTRVMVHSDEDIVRDGLGAIVGGLPGVELVEPRPDDLHLDDVDVVLLDLTETVDLDTSLVDRLVRVATPAVVVVTHDLRRELADRALARGVDGCIPLTATRDEVGAVLRSAAWGDLLGERSVDALDYTGNPAVEDALPTLDVGLSAREEEVLALIGSGSSNQQIADRLFLSINSVKTHIRSVYRKIGAESRSHAVLWFVEHGASARARTDQH